MPHYCLNDIAEEISIRENNPSTSEYDRFVGLEHYEAGEIEIHNFGNTRNLESAMKVFKAGDTLVARRNVYLKRASIVHFEGLTSGDSIVLRAKNKIYEKLLPFILNTNKFWDYAKKYADGTMSKRLSPSILKQYEFYLPDINTQQDLAELLWAAEETKQKYKHMLSKTRDMLQASFIYLFGDPIKNNKNWTTEKLGSIAPICSAKKSISSKIWLLNLDMIEQDTGKIIDKIYVHESEIGTSTYAFDDSMVLYSKLRPYLNKVVVPDEEGYATTELVSFKPKQDILNKYFLAELLRSKDFVDYAVSLSGGARMPRTPMDKLKNFECIVPPMELQNLYIEICKKAHKTEEKLIKNIDYIKIFINNLLMINFAKEVSHVQ